MPARAATNSTFDAVRSRLLAAPSILVLLAWVAIPLTLTVSFSLQSYNLLSPDRRSFVGLQNYAFLMSDPTTWAALVNTIVLVTACLGITITFGLLFAQLLQQRIYGRPFVRLLAVAPFFVMPTVSALLWKNMMLHPVNGVMASLLRWCGLPAVDWFGDLPLLSVIVIVSWQWLPFAMLVLLTSLQSLDVDQLAAARLDGAGSIASFRFVTLPHLRRSISVVIMLETIFFMAIFAEILVTTSGGPGVATTNLAFLIYQRGLLEYDIGAASAAGVFAVVLANLAAIALIRTVARDIGA
jgi:sorbitol/mannitol transport system permease protein